MTIIHILGIALIALSTLNGVWQKLDDTFHLRGRFTPAPEPCEQKQTPPTPKRKRRVLVKSYYRTA